MAKITIKDVAKAAQVSPATVDRALHGRGSVGHSALVSINEAIQSLGFGQTTNELTEKLGNKIRLCFIIPKGGGGFISHLKKEIQRVCDDEIGVKVIPNFQEIEMMSPILACELSQAKRENMDAIGLFAIDTNEVRDAVDRCIKQGIPVTTMVSDVPAAHRSTYVGIDNNAAGRTAGRLMGKFLRNETGKVAVITGLMSIRDHMERFFGFRDIMLREYRNLTVLPAIETESLDRYILESIEELFEKDPDILGIYTVTGGISGILSALRNKETGKRPVLIAHDLSTVTRRGLISGEIDALINQDATQIARATVSHMLAELMPNRTRMTSAKGGIPIEVFLKDNLP